MVVFIGQMSFLLYK